MRRRRFLVVVGITVVAVVLLVVVTRSGSGPSPRAGDASPAHDTPTARHTTATTSSSTTTSTSTTTVSTSTTTTTTDPGSLPQTAQFPSSSTPQFAAEMDTLWRAVVEGSVTPALPSFFPRSAYVQLKTGIADASDDWQNRLVSDFGLDIKAAHALLGPNPSEATLVSVSVPEQYGHWIPPGVCANGIGYFEVPNSRVIYQVGGQTRSFGIASMISWRGTWYVVHLGAILRGSGGGEVDEPSVGPGVSAPSSTC